MSSFGGGHVRPKGVIPHFWCYMPWRVSVGLMYALLARLTRSLGNSHVSSDHGPTPSPISSILPQPLIFAKYDFMLGLPKREDPSFIPCFIRPSSLFPLCLPVRRFRFHPGIDVDARLCLKQPPRRHSARSRPTGSGCSLCPRALARLGSVYWE